VSEVRPLVLHDAPCDEGWDDDVHGRVAWRTLWSADRTPTEALTAGVAELAPGDRLAPHRHSPPELYYVLAGEGVVTMEDAEHDVRAGTAVFIPGDARHGIRNTGPGPLRFLYAFAVDAFGEVEYRYDTAP